MSCWVLSRLTQAAFLEGFFGIFFVVKVWHLIIVFFWICWCLPRHLNTVPSFFFFYFSPYCFIYPRLAGLWGYKHSNMCTAFSCVFNLFLSSLPLSIPKRFPSFYTVHKWVNVTQSSWPDKAQMFMSVWYTGICRCGDCIFSYRLLTEGLASRIRNPVYVVWGWSSFSLFAIWLLMALSHAHAQNVLRCLW